MPSGTYTIEKYQLPLVGVAAHNYWVIKDPNGNVISELHGLATGSDGNRKAIGTSFSDTIF